MSKKKEELILLKRDHVNYKFDYLLIALSFLLMAATITLSSVYQKYLFILACIIFILISFDAIHTIRMKKKNNHVIKDCITYVKSDNAFLLVDILALESSVLVKDVIKVKRDNLWTYYTYIYVKDYQDDGTYIEKKINLGYTNKKDFEAFKDKLKTLIEISSAVEA